MFFFFKQKTAYEMRISDWSSDVCSADQFGGEGFGGFVRPAGEDELVELFGLVADCRHDARVGVAVGGDPPARDGVDPASTVVGMDTGFFGVRTQRLGIAASVLGDGVPVGVGVCGFFVLPLFPF